MDKVQKIREEVERLQDLTMDKNKNFYSEAAEGEYNALCNIGHFIDSLQEEPVSESIDFEQELYKSFGQIKDFTLGIAIAKRFYDMGRKHNEPVSDDLEEAAHKYADGENPVCLCEECLIKTFKAGAKWQEDKDQGAVEIAREEIYEWLRKNHEEYQYKAPYNYFDIEQCIDDLKQAMKDE